MSYTHYICEGLDRIGKSSLIDGIISKNGYFSKLHFSKPIECKPYLDYYNPLLTYQSKSFITGFELLDQKHNPFIMDRFHLGEVVYSPLYRGYEGDYVFSLERDYKVDNWDHVKLLLLITTDFSVLEDDGNSFDFSRKEEEQDMFLTAFERSIFKHKQIINIIDRRTNMRKSVQQILDEII